MVSARLYVPTDWAHDRERCLSAGIPNDLGFKTRPQLAAEIVRQLLAERCCPPWVTGDDVYGRDAKLRQALEDNRIGYVVKIPAPSASRCPLGRRGAPITPSGWSPPPPGRPSRAGMAPRVSVTTGGRGWPPPPPATTCSSAAVSPTPPAYFSCHVPAGRACSFTTLIRIAGRRWTVEEDSRSEFVPTLINQEDVVSATGNF